MVERGAQAGRSALVWGATAILVLAALLVAGLVHWQRGTGSPPAQSASLPDAVPDLSEPMPDDHGAGAVFSTPAFDVVRVDPDGGAVIAGHAAPGARVTVLLDGVAQTEIEADAGGHFVAMVDLPPDQAPRVLSLSAESDGQQVVSDEDIILAPIAPGASPDPAEAGSGGDGTETLTEDDAAGEGAADIALLRSDAAGVELLGRGGATGQAAATEGITLDTITYGADGAVRLQGRARPGGHVRIYLDDRLIGDSSGENGGWQALLADVPPGDYRLRLDELSAGGDVVGRLETPFRRESAEALERALPDPARAGPVTVQPGDTLWAISRERYGEGLLYVRVFEANRAAIRNPDLIYPGQVFTLPE
ncbi:LysM peptidoglycan-binding domain-containing protein [Pontibaca methylaminivorans]|uniref:LysM domain-containing protein n=1 Tax=Pontibaca methylaminivorans TaxID=515897 RepID=A0A1R3W945_9RHOB|nr:LysM peptidoglycan-binding domain-containing protein [Pontibaca methylaminivorans]SIT74498.1 LysM domain-containing protein [Pontibaca methylaminivorans]